jgi:hypothetical protein
MQAMNDFLVKLMVGEKWWINRLSNSIAGLN